MALSAIAWSAIGTWKLIMIGLATPTIEPLSGLNDGGRNGGAPVTGVGSCPPAGPAATGSCQPGRAASGGGGAKGSGGGGGINHGGRAGGAGGAGTASGSGGAATLGSSGGWSQVFGGGPRTHHQQSGQSGRVQSRKDKPPRPARHMRPPVTSLAQCRITAKAS